MWFFLLLVTTLAAALPSFQAGDLNATWVCDAPMCPMVCRPKCAALNCTTSCDEGFTCSETPHCQVDCPYTENGILVTEDCPTCSSSCNPLSCGNCTATCEPLNCEWECFVPNNCPYPRCELQAGTPACHSASANSVKLGVALLTVLVLAMFV